MRHPSGRSGQGQVNRNSRAQQAEETLAVLERGRYRAPDGTEVDLRADLERCLAATRLWQPEELARTAAGLRAGTTPRTDDARLELVNETTLQGASQLAAESGGARVGVLNFASARHPGGGFLGGSQAQEESLARSSALYASLRRQPDFYEHHRQSPSLLYSDRVIVSPDCPVFRRDDGLFLARPYWATFLTAPAPNRGALEAQQASEVGRIPAVFRQRIELVLAAARQAECEDLVLGAWGCGVFRNDPALVAGLFAEWLAPGTFWRRSFRRLRFSVFDRSAGGEVFAAFARYFGEARP
ncbi:MAG: TIGR02452 family protein [Verrucomicrobia bacterium]|nr:TIGR02452 family protein [Verrucomicrobiota bacterium]